MYAPPPTHRIDVRYNLDDIWELSEGRFEPFVVQAPELWLVKFMAPWQQECRALIPLWNKLARLLKGVVRVGVVDCQRYWALCERHAPPPPGHSCAAGIEDIIWRITVLGHHLNNGWNCLMDQHLLLSAVLTPIRPALPRRYQARPVPALLAMPSFSLHPFVIRPHSVCC